MKKVKLLLVGLLIIGKINAQTDDLASGLIKVLPLSPNAASLGKYGDVPVGYYTGVPNINVPIYTIEVGDIKVPLTLNCHTGGVKVEDIASWVGMGWSFSFGGSINRQMRGLADEDGSGYLSSASMIDQFHSWPISQQEAYITSTQQGLADSQNDIFNYSVGGQSGKFFFKPNGDIITKPLNKIVFQYGNFFGKTGWKAVATNGLVYYFLDKEITTSFASSLPASGDPVTATSSWYITKIVSAEGKDSVAFEYDTETVNYTSNLSQTVYLMKSPVSSCSQHTSFSTSSTTTFALRLKKIKFRNGQVIVNAAATERTDLPGSHALQTIQILSDAGREIKRYDFNYTTLSSSAGAEGSRLFLDSIQVSSSQMPLGTYKFEYESREQLPGRKSYSQDHWGYYNGATNTTLVPYFYYAVNGNNHAVYPGADRQPNPTFSKAGTLKRIYYPTGGYTELEMENNTVSNLLAVMPDGYDFNDVTKRFQIYGDAAGQKTTYSGTFSVTSGFGGTGGVMAGIQIGLPGSSSVPPPPASDTDPVIMVTQPDGSTLFLRNNVTMFFKEGTYKVDIDFSPNPGPTLIRNFYLIITYSSGIRDNPDKLKNCIVGGLRVKSIKDVDPITGMVSQRSFSYLQDDGVTSTGVLQNFPSYTGYIATCNGIGTSGATACNFTLLGSLSQSTMYQTQGSYVGYSMVDEMIDQGNNGKNRYYYTMTRDKGTFNAFPYPPSDDRDELRGILLKQQTFKKIGNTGNFAIVSEKSFNYDFINGYTSNDPLTVTVPGLSFRQIYQPGDGCVYSSGTALHIASDFSTTSGFIKLLSDTSRLYDVDNQNKMSQIISNYEYSLSNLQVNKTSTYKSTGDLSVVTHSFPLDYNVSSSSADDKMNGLNTLIAKHKINEPIESTEYISKNGGPLQLVGSTFLSYNSSVGKPGTIYKLDISQPVSDFVPSVVQSNALTIDSRYSPRFVFNKYLDNGNLQQQQRASDISKAYIWDYNNAYAIAEINNADISQVAYTSFETDNLGNWSLNPGSTILSNNGNVTGKNSLNGGVSATVPQGNYILSLWSASTPTLNGQPFPIPAKKTIGPGKSYYEIELDNTSSVIVSGSNIDEVRLYPKGAQMVTLTYEPLVGVTSQSDARGYINYYEYDGAGRLADIKNENGEVVKTINYHYIHQ